jgi:hypothetical protein
MKPIDQTTNNLSRRIKHTWWISQKEFDEVWKNSKH